MPKVNEILSKNNNFYNFKTIESLKKQLTHIRDTLTQKNYSYSFYNFHFEFSFINYTDFFDLPKSYNETNFMHPRQDIGLLACSGIAALIVLGVTAQAPLLPTLYIISIFVLIALILRNFGVKREAWREKIDIEQKKKRSRLTIWTQVIDAMPNACVLIDKDKRIIHANKEAKSLAKIETLGRLFTSYIRGADLNLALDNALSGKPTKVIDIHKITPTEQHLRIRLTSKTLNRYSTEQRYLLATISDITEDKVSEIQKADFLANASHELKTPIASLLGYIETLRHHAKEDSKAREKFLGIMQSQAERMVRLIDDLLSLRKIEQSEHIVPDELTDLNQSITTAIEALKPIADKRGVHLSYQNPQEALTQAQSDETVQVFLNLIGNAIKFTPKGGQVDIKLKFNKKWESSNVFENTDFLDTASTRRIVEYAHPVDKDGVWQMKIRDWGRGFSREHLPRLGERFYRVAGDLSSKEKGTGLGLAIVKHIVIRHRAGLYICTQDQIGTEFTLIMPAIVGKKLKNLSDKAIR